MTPAGAATPASAAAPAAEPPVMLTELNEGVLLVKFNRPERMNASIPPMIRRYTEIMLEAAEDPKVRVIVVTGEGRAFCAGADTTYLGSLSGGGNRPDKLRRHWFPTMIPKPVIAAVNGHCLGLGFVMAMMCDMRFASDATKMGPKFAALGLPAENACGWVLPRVVGYARAFEILTSGLLYSGDDLTRLGLVNGVVPEAELLPHTLRVATRLARECSPRSFATIKTQLQRSYYTDIREADRLSDVLATHNLVKPDLKEAIQARKEKRPPNFPPLGPQDDWWPVIEKMPGDA